MRNKFAYSCSIKIHVLGFDKFLERTFHILLVVEVFSLQNVIAMLEEVVVGERSGEYGGWGKLCILICSTFEALVVQHAVRCCHGEELDIFC